MNERIGRAKELKLRRLEVFPQSALHKIFFISFITVHILNEKENRTSVIYWKREYFLRYSLLKSILNFARENERIE